MPRKQPLQNARRLAICASQNAVKARMPFRKSLLYKHLRWWASVAPTLP